MATHSPPAALRAFEEALTAANTAPGNRPALIEAAKQTGHAIRTATKPIKDKIAVNGLYRHGFLLAPALAELTLGYVARGVIDNEVMQCA